ncbi:hypothetical protein M231_05071 [Tremella mesenterica]|uniref:Ubiquinone biosynthesis protein n=1 Tax=Tremella mesenterica TaxID=5217 RepID=A0A4Q1BJ00_TREME|nr:hypothetical protein M231_05071 [Tremella mesenterica]
MSFRQTILNHSLPLIPKHSFTRSTLSYSLSSLPTSHPSYRPPLEDSVIDTIFGPGHIACKALVDAWEEEGLKRLSIVESGSEEKLEDILKRRLKYSYEVGEHLVEAYALFSTPQWTPSLPIPIQTLTSLLPSINFPSPYNPPHTSTEQNRLDTYDNIKSTYPNPYSKIQNNLKSNPLSELQGIHRSDRSDPLSELQNKIGSNLLFPIINPLGVLGYLWRISDSALSTSQGSSLKKTSTGDILGAGTSWYLSRIGLSLVYLSAESKLLQPYPAQQTPNPHLPAALDTLEKNMKSYADFQGMIDNSETVVGDMIGFAEYVTRSWKGIIRSRGL